MWSVIYFSGFIKLFHPLQWKRRIWNFQTFPFLQFESCTSEVWLNWKMLNTGSLKQNEGRKTRSVDRVFLLPAWLSLLPWRQRQYIPLQSQTTSCHVSEDCTLLRVVKACTICKITSMKLLYVSSDHYKDCQPFFVNVNDQTKSGVKIINLYC